MKFTLPNILVAGQLLIFFVLLGAIVVLPIGDNTLLRLLGLLGMVVGIWIVVAAIRAHRVNSGVNISPTPRAEGQMINSGLYASIRHPIYTGAIIAAIGAALFHGHGVVLIVALVLVPFLTYKSHVEERYLQATYSGYAEYMRHTGRFIPPMRRMK